MKNVADKSQVKKAEYKEKFFREQELNDIRSVLAEKPGRRFVWRYLAECGVFKTSFTGSSETFFKEGMRNIGLKLLADINDASPESYMVMVKEDKELKEKENG